MTYVKLKAKFLSGMKEMAQIKTKQQKDFKKYQNELSDKKDINQEEIHANDS